MKYKVRPTLVFHVVHLGVHVVSHLDAIVLLSYIRRVVVVFLFLFFSRFACLVQLQNYTSNV